MEAISSAESNKGDVSVGETLRLAARSNATVSSRRSALTSHRWNCRVTTCAIRHALRKVSRKSHDNKQQIDQNCRIVVQSDAAAIESDTETGKGKQDTKTIPPSTLAAAGNSIRRSSSW